VKKYTTFFKTIWNDFFSPYRQKSYPAWRSVFRFVELKASVHACRKTKFCNQTHEMYYGRKRYYWI